MKPKTLTITTLLMTVLNVLGYASLWDVPKQHVVFLFLVFTLLITVGYVVLWFYWRGKNWARVLVLLSSLLCFYNLYSLIQSSHPTNVIVKVMVLGEAGVAGFLLYWLNTSEAKTYFGVAKARVTE